MDKDTLHTKKWLDERFAIGVKDGRYLSHQPIYGYMKGRTEGRDLIRYARILSNLKYISMFTFNSFIDIGGAEGYTAYIVRKAFNADSYTCDLSTEANMRAQELFCLDSAGIDLSNLPFKDEAFDIVLCSEVLEHVTRPVQSICELKRIAKKGLIITTESICYDKIERRLRMLSVCLDEGHADRNWYLMDDFSALLGRDIVYKNTMPSSGLFKKKGYSVDDAVEILKTYDSRPSFGREGLGVSILLAKEPPDRPEGTDVDALINAMLNTTADIEYSKNINKAQRRNDGWSGLLRCPKCLGMVIDEGGGILCRVCGKIYKSSRGVPLMYTDQQDGAYLAEKWNRIYDGMRNPDHDEIIKLISVFDQKRSNWFTRSLARSLLKIKGHWDYLSALTCGRPVNHILQQLISDIKKKVKRELDRLTGRFRVLKPSDLKAGDLVEFVNDYNRSGVNSVSVKKGAFGKISAAINGRIDVKVDGCDKIISLQNDIGKGLNEICYVKKPLN